MRSAAWVTAPQIALRDCSEEVGESIYVILVTVDFMPINNILFLWKVSASREKVITMEDFSAFLDIRRYKNWDHETGS